MDQRGACGGIRGFLCTQENKEGSQREIQQQKEIALQGNQRRPISSSKIFRGLTDYELGCHHHLTLQRNMGLSCSQNVGKGKKLNKVELSRPFDLGPIRFRFST